MPTARCICRSALLLRPAKHGVILISGWITPAGWVSPIAAAVRRLIVDWDIHARQALAEFRAATTPVRHDRVMTELVARLSDASTEFRSWWPEHDVARFETRLRRSDHPRAGILTFEYQQLTPAEWPGLRVVVQLPVPGDDSARRLAVRHDAF